MKQATEAWVLYNLQAGAARPAELQREFIPLDGLEPDEVLVEPLYGSWEGNLEHAISRRPIDIAHQRGEERVVVGNTGVVRVLRPGRAVTHLKEGDVCVSTVGVWAKRGFMQWAFAYDAPGTVGFFAKRTKMLATQLTRIPAGTRHLLPQWAAFSGKYITAWANWKVASRVFEILRPRDLDFVPWVWGWGGGTAFAEVSLARRMGYQAALISSSPARLSSIERAGLTPVDRRPFRDLIYDETKLRRDPEYAARYSAAEKDFLKTVYERTRGEGVSIFVDQIGAAVTRATLKALARPGVLTTSGWKTGMQLSSNRAMAAMHWHTHVHTHYARFEDIPEAVAYGEEHGWMPDIQERIREWEEIPQLAEDYRSGKTSTYFQIYRVNPE